MLVTLLVIYCVRPILRCPTRRRRAISLLLIAAALITSDGGLRAVCGEDRLGRRPLDSSSAMSSSTERSVDHGERTSLFANEQKLREGTVIPPTIGRVINLGRRWAFIPIDHDYDTGNQFRAQSIDADKPSTRQLGGPSGRPSMNRGVDLSWEPEPTAYRDGIRSSLIRHQDGEESDPNQRSQHIVLCENQMLQRIVEATRADANDDRWEISGEIMEFFDQNRLLIRTVQRANAN